MTTCKNSSLPAYSQQTAVCVAPPSQDLLGTTRDPNKRVTKIGSVQFGYLVSFGTLLTVPYQTEGHRSTPGKRGYGDPKNFKFLSTFEGAKSQLQTPKYFPPNMGQDLKNTGSYISIMVHDSVIHPSCSLRA